MKKKTAKKRENRFRGYIVVTSTNLFSKFHVSRMKSIVVMKTDTRSNVIALSCTAGPSMRTASLPFHNDTARVHRVRDTTSTLLFSKSTQHYRHLPWIKRCS